MPATTTGLPLVRPPQRMVRLGFAPEPWVFWPDAHHAAGPPTGRWDHPERRYRVLYAATDPVGCWLEVLAPLRPELTTMIEMQRIQGGPQERDYPTAVAGTVKRTVFRDRILGWASSPGGLYVDVGATKSIASLRPRLAQRLVHYRVDLDGAALRQSAPRGLTQEISALLFDERVGQESVAGVRYESRWGNDVVLWAVFERPGLHIRPEEPIVVDPETDPAVLEVMELYQLTLGPTEAEADGGGGASPGAGHRSA